MGTLHGHGSTSPENRSVQSVNPIPEHISPLLAAGAAMGALLVTLGLEKVGRGRTSLLAALLIGSMLGPGVLGRVAPDVYDGLRGSEASAVHAPKQAAREQEARTWLESQRTAERTPPSPAATKPVQRLVEPGIVHWGVAGCCILLMAVVCVRDGRWSLSDVPMGGTLALGAAGAGLLAARLVGAPQDRIPLIVFCGSCAAAACTRWGGFGARRLQMSGPARMSTLATVSCMVLLLTTGEASGNPGLPGAVLLAAPLLACLLSSKGRPWLSGLRSALAGALPPMIIAVSMVSIDPLEHLDALWLGLLAWLAMSDLRTVLAALLLRSNGSRWPKAWMTSLQLLGSEVMPVALGGYALWILGVPPTITLGLFVAAAITQVEGMTRGTAGRLIRSSARMPQIDR